MEYKGVQIPDVLFNTNKIMQIEGGEVWRVSVAVWRQISEMTKSLPEGTSYIQLRIEDSTEEAPSLVIEAVSQVPGSDEDNFDRIAEQMDYIDKNHN